MVAASALIQVGVDRAKGEAVESRYEQMLVLEIAQRWI